jgi:hypothetical protein
VLDLSPLEDTGALDVADRGRHDLHVVGRKMNMVQERVRQLAIFAGTCLPMGSHRQRRIVSTASPTSSLVARLGKTDRSRLRRGGRCA